MAFLPLARVETAPPSTKAVLEATVQKWGYLPNIVAALALRPELLHAEDAWTKALMHQGTLPRSLKEAVATTVSMANQCNYCATSHDFAAGQAGASAEVRAACKVLRFDGLPEAERLALDFARKAAADMRSVRQEDVDLLRKHYSAEQVVELAAVIGSFMLYNTFVTVLGLELEPQHGQGLLPEGLDPADGQ
jgi:uncharacterized peroxidase-related enzyme